MYAWAAAMPARAAAIYSLSQVDIANGVGTEEFASHIVKTACNVSSSFLHHIIDTEPCCCLVVCHDNNGRFFWCDLGKIVVFCAKVLVIVVDHVCMG